MSLNSTDKKTTRTFGLIAVLFFGVLCGVGIWHARPLAIAIFGLLCLMGLGLLLAPVRLRPLHAGWLKVSHLIGKTITTVMLALAYYVVITPAALIKRIFSGRPIALKPDKSLSSYWVTRAEPGQPKERFSKRF